VDQRSVICGVGMLPVFGFEALSYQRSRNVHIATIEYRPNNKSKVPSLSKEIPTSPMGFQQQEKITLCHRMFQGAMVPR